MFGTAGGRRERRWWSCTDDSQAVPVDVAGEWVLSTNAPNGYRWKLSEPDEAERLRLENQSATAIDAAGDAYGLAEWNVAGRQVDDEVPPLPKLSDETEGYDAGAATVTAASDDGSRLVGSAMDDEGDARAVVWRCGRAAFAGMRHKRLAGSIMV